MEIIPPWKLFLFSMENSLHKHGLRKWNQQKLLMGNNGKSFFIRNHFSTENKMFRTNIPFRDQLRWGEEAEKTVHAQICIGDSFLNLFSVPVLSPSNWLPRELLDERKGRDPFILFTCFLHIHTIISLRFDEFKRWRDRVGTVDGFLDVQIMHKTFVLLKALFQHFLF